jgi:hypothetical protein
MVDALAKLRRGGDEYARSTAYADSLGVANQRRLESGGSAI